MTKTKQTARFLVALWLIVTVVPLLFGNFEGAATKFVGIGLWVGIIVGIVAAIEKIVLISKNKNEATPPNVSSAPHETCTLGEVQATELGKEDTEPDPLHVYILDDAATEHVTKKTSAETPFSTSGPSYSSKASTKRSETLGVLAFVAIFALILLGAFFQGNIRPTQTGKYHFDVNRGGSVEQEAQDSTSTQALKTITNRIGMKLVLIPKGTFQMGSKLSPKEVDQRYPGKNEKYYEDETPHQVVLSQSFYMSIHEVTVGQFRNFVEAEKYETEAETDAEGGWGYDQSTKNFSQTPKYTWRIPGFVKDDNHPVVNVSWNDAVAFCRWLSRVEGREYRLPTEAEWEYSCRAGSSGEFSFGDDAEQLVGFGNVADATLKRHFPNFINDTVSSSDGLLFTSRTGSYQSNEFGLYDMHGNVWEWCSDWYGEYPRSSVTDPAGPATGSYRVYRGGGWGNAAASCRSAYRGRYTPSSRSISLGFRIALVPVASAEFESSTGAGGLGAIAPAVTFSGSVAQNGTKNAQTGDILEEYRRIKAANEANTGSLSRDVSAGGSKAVAPTWANQNPDPTYDDPEEQAIMLSRKRDPTRRLM
ncbi:MAG: formylglycine-generating enzyme family protein, partial [Planctomycetota bacterium]